MTGVAVRAVDAAAWRQHLGAFPGAPLTADPGFIDIVAKHSRAGRSLYMVAELDGAVAGGLAGLVRRHRGIDRLECGVEGTPGGPLLAPDLPAATAHAVVAALCDHASGMLRGRLAIAALTPPWPAVEAAAAPPAGWRAVAYESAVVACGEGADHVGRKLWTNNRRNERNRGLKRGCTLQEESHADALAQWYPLYEAGAAGWSQAPLSQALLADLVSSCSGRVIFNTVRLDGRLVGGHVCLRWGDRLLAWQGGVDPSVARTHFPTTLLYWQDIVWAADRGLAAVDFGGCVGRDSLRDFKRRCGAVFEPRVQLTARSPLGRLHGLLADLRGRWRRGR